jgi:tRNA-modifying protein YgfZ
MSDEAALARASATYVVSEADRGILAVSGSERATWLNGVVTCDATQAVPGRAVFGLLLSKQGKIQTDFVLLASSVRLFLAVAPGTVEVARAELERMLVMEDAELTDVSGELALVSLVGGGAPELARTVSTAGSRVTGDIERPGLPGVVLLVPRGELPSALASLEAAGAVRPSPTEWETVRLARHAPSFGRDYGPGDNPHEAGLERSAVSWTKGCYLGQEVVFMQDARGKLKRRLVPLSVPAGVPAVGAELRSGPGEVVGEVTSVAPLGTGAVAFARVRAPHFEPGTRLVVSGFPAEVAPAPAPA